MRLSSLWTAPVALSAAFAQGADAGSLFLRDAPGGEFGDQTPGGFYLTGTGSRPMGTFDGTPIHHIDVGAFALEANFGSGWQPLITYCIEPVSVIAFGLNPGDTTGSPYTTDLLTNAGFTSDEAVFIEKMWANAYDNSLINRVRAAAFQALLWEMRQDSVINFDAGLSRLDGSDNFTANVRNVTQNWINRINNGEWSTRTALMALVSPNSQDYLAPVIPGPGAVAGLLAAGLLGTSRRRRT